MNEIEKLYENAKVFCLHPSGFCKHIGATCERCERHKYPPFTAEKQLELIKLFSSNSIGFGTCIEEFCRKENFEEALAERINRLWQSLVVEEKEQIRGILNG